MNLLNPKIVILIILLLLIFAVLVFLKIQLPNQGGNRQPSSDIKVFNRTTPSPTPLIPYEQLPRDEKMRLQTISDDNYAKTQDAILKLYPWYNTLPIKAQNYFVYFETDKKQFTALLYPQKSSATSIEVQVEEFKKGITGQLKNIDPKTLDLPINWEVKPE